MRNLDGEFYATRALCAPAATWTCALEGRVSILAPRSGQSAKIPTPKNSARPGELVGASKKGGKRHIATKIRIPFSSHRRLCTSAAGPHSKNVSSCAHSQIQR